MSTQAQIKEIDRLIAELEQKLTTHLEGAVHIPRTTPLPRGVSTILSNRDCEPGCPACAEGVRLAKLKMELGRLQRLANHEFAQGAIQAGLMAGKEGGEARTDQAKELRESIRNAAIQARKDKPTIQDGELASAVKKRIECHITTIRRHLKALKSEGSL